MDARTVGTVVFVVQPSQFLSTSTSIAPVSTKTDNKKQLEITFLCGYIDEIVFVEK